MLQETLFKEYADTPKAKKSPKLKSLYSYKLKWIKEDTIPYSCEPIKCPHDTADILSKFYEGADREYFTIVLLNIKNKVIGLHNVSMGSLTASVVHPREVFKAACMGNAAALILAHNHPSGDPTPSKEDLNITRQLIQASKVMDIPILDHIVMGDGKYVSMMEEGYIQ